MKNSTNESPESIENSGSYSSLSVDVQAKELSKEFVNYLQSLFDILDHDHRGFIKLTDFERYWDKGSATSSVIDYLRKVSPKATGLLNFETLCTGLTLTIRHPEGKLNSQSVNVDREWASDSSEDSFRLHDVGKDTRLLNINCQDWGLRSLSEEKLDYLPAVASTENLSTKPSSGTLLIESEELRGGNIDWPKVDKKKRSTAVEEELDILKSGLTIIEKVRKWYFKRITAVQEEKLHLQQTDQHSLEQFQYEMLLHKTRRNELNLDERAFACYQRNIQDLNKYLMQLIENPHEKLDTCSQNTQEKTLEQLKVELTQKNSRITQLEREKSALIRDLFNIKTPSGSAKSSSDKH